MMNLYKAMLFSLICTFLVSCSHNSSNTIRIGILNGPSEVSFIQMIDQPPVIGGMKTEFIIKNEPLQIQALMMQNKLDFAILPTVMAVNLYNKDIKFRMIACPIWGTLYLLSNEKNASLDKLSGNSVAVFGQSGTSDILLKHMLAKKQIKNVNVDYNYNTNHEIGVALLSKKISYGVVSEPLVSILLEKDKSIHIVQKIVCEEYLGNTDKNIFVQTSFLVNSRFSTENQAIVSQICEAYSASCNFTSEQPQKTAEKMVKHGISPNVHIAQRSIPLCNINYVGAFAIEQEIQRYLQIFYNFNPKSIGGSFPEKDFIYQTY